MNKIVQSDEGDSKVERVKSGRINFPAHRGARRILCIGSEAGLGLTIVKGIPCTMET
jgi:hypothetical protein